MSAGMEGMRALGCAKKRVISLRSWLRLYNLPILGMRALSCAGGQFVGVHVHVTFGGECRTDLLGG